MDERAAEAEQSIKDMDGTVTSLTHGELERGDYSFATVNAECEVEGETYYMEILYFTIKDSENDIYAVGQLGAMSDNTDTLTAAIEAFMLG